MIKITEIYSHPNEYDPEIETVRATYGLRQIYINPESVLFLKENLELNSKGKKGALIKDLSKDATFTELSLGTTGVAFQKINVVGSPDVVSRNINRWLLAR